MNKKNVVFGFLGTTLDARGGAKRWEAWRPSISLCAHDHLHVDRLELFLTLEKHEGLFRQVKEDIEKISPGTVVVSRKLELDDPWNFQLTYATLHDFAADYPFVDSENYFVHLTTGTHTAQLCLFMLSEARHFPGKLVDTHVDKTVEEQWRGRLEVIDLNLAVYDQLASRFAKKTVASESLLKSGIATKNPAFNRLISDVEKVCVRSSAPILLTGETGVGKSQLAKRIYDLRLRQHKVEGAFVEVNCATLRGDNAMSTLFGHRKGAFTGAIADRPGLLLAAHKGILFLDEIGTLGLAEQAMLLRALEKKSFFPLGPDKEVTSDFQLLSGTNLDLTLEVQEGRFRADLYERVKLWAFKLPSLKDRSEDIAPNIEHELEAISAELKCRVSFNTKAYDNYLAFAEKAPWPGNFRDLSASIMRMATLADGGRIREDEVESEIGRLEATWPSSAAGGTAAFNCGMVSRLLPDARMDAYDEARAEAVLRAVKDTSSMAEAGRALFAVSREERKSVNDSHRVRVLLASWGLDYKQVKAMLAQCAG